MLRKMLQKNEKNFVAKYFRSEVVLKNFYDINRQLFLIFVCQVNLNFSVQNLGLLSFKSNMTYDKFCS